MITCGYTKDGERVGVIYTWYDDHVARVDSCGIKSRRCTENVSALHTMLACVDRFMRCAVAVDVRVAYLALAEGVHSRQRRRCDCQHEVLEERDCPPESLQGCGARKDRGIGRVLVDVLLKIIRERCERR